MKQVFYSFYRIVFFCFMMWLAFLGSYDFACVAKGQAKGASFFYQSKQKGAGSLALADKPYPKTQANTLRLAQKHKVLLAQDDTVKTQNDTIETLLNGSLQSEDLPQGSAQDFSKVANPQEANEALEKVQKIMQLSQEKISHLLQEVSALKKDENTLTQALIKTAALERKESDKAIKTNKDLEQLLLKKQKIEIQLNAKRAEVAHILAALERMGLEPPPAMLAGPNDVATSLRSAVLLGTLLSTMQQKAHALYEILKKVNDLANKIEQQEQDLKQEIISQKEQRKKLELLLAEKKKLVEKSQEGLRKERAQNEKLAQKAKSLQELLMQLDRKAHEDPAESALFDAAQQRLAQAIPFEDLKGLLPVPVSGEIVHFYKTDKDDPLEGEVFATSPDAVVTAPADAIVAYSGKFRSYGQLIILEMGHGYYILLAGLAQTNVDRGAFVLKGEPIGTMGEKSVAPALNITLNSKTPLLYVAFRKEATAINPAPWWIKGICERNINDQ